MERLLGEMILAVKEASEAVMKVYQRKFEIKIKDDASPVTEADLLSDKIIRARLEKYSDIAFLSEEEQDDLSRLNKEAIFVVDPLDGTQDFVNKDGSFGINLALVINHQPVLSVIGLPYDNMIAYARQEKGSFLIDPDGNEKRLRVSNQTENLILLASKTHELDEEKQVYIRHRDLVKEVKHFGASLKAVKLASGEADASIRYTTQTKEWDICAPDLLVREAGGLFTDTKLQPFTYNRRDVYNHFGYCMFNRKENEILLK